MLHDHTLDRAVPKSTRNAQHVVLWILQLAAAAMFLMAGSAKLAGAPEMVALFDAVGVGQWFRYVTGTMEVSGAILLLVPALAGVGALVLAAVTVGAIFTHHLVIGGSPLLPIVLLVVVGIIAYGRHERTARLLGR
jgi:putative oxidoreductase